MEKEHTITDRITNLKGLILSQIMSPLHALLLRKGEKYDCGADYDDTTLNQSVEELLMEDRYNGHDCPLSEEDGCQVCDDYRDYKNDEINNLNANR